MNSRSQLYQYKGSRCAACELSVQEMIDRYGTFNRMFNFHHIEPDSKGRDYKRLMAQRLSRSQLEEIDKCVLLCVQCHSTIHAQDLRAHLTLSAQIESRIVSQRLEGWLKVDRLAGKTRFVTNEPYLLQPCEVIVGNEPSRRLFLREIEEQSNLHEWLSNMGRHRVVQIFSLQTRRMAMRLEHIEGGRISVLQSIGFPLTSMEFRATNFPGEVIHFRNGIVLTRSGEVFTQGELSYELDLDIHSAATS